MFFHEMCGCDTLLRHAHCGTYSSCKPLLAMARNTASGLLPRVHSDFRRRRYWDSFFKKRDQETFEWCVGWKGDADVIPGITRCG